MIHNDTISFLKKLKRNNNKTWFDDNREKYLAAKEDFEFFLTALLPELGKMDASLKGIEVKNCLFRIYRDVRFSSDKTPYKTHFGAWICSRGRKSSGPGYYFHLQPGNTFVAAGIWMPEAKELAAVRQEIDYNFEEFSSLISEKSFRKFTDGIETEDSLKTAPKGYPKDHPAIEFLKLKSFTASAMIDDQTVLSNKLLREALKRFEAMVPLNRFLSRALD